MLIGLIVCVVYILQAMDMSLVPLTAMGEKGYSKYFLPTRI
jgi:hypothetical protein